MRPEDDGPHPVGPEPDFNESVYLHLHDPAAGIGGFVRLANRPNEGRGERTVCLFLPDGRLAFSFARPRGTTNDAFDAAGLRITVREPFALVDVEFRGDLSLVADPAAMADPRAALGVADTVGCRLDLTVSATGPVYEHSFDTGEGSFAPNHHEQLLHAEGTLVLGDDEVPLRGYGLRDHSWGPRSWQAPWFYRWLHGSGDGFGFMGAWFGRPDGSAVTGGFVHEDGALHLVEDVQVSTERDAADEQTAVTLVLAAGDRRWRLTGRTLAKVPLRHRRDDGSGAPTTRIVEALTTWTREDGSRLHGMTEYLDQIVDDRPVGLLV